jgi:hypothetical protein
MVLKKQVEKRVFGKLYAEWCGHCQALDIFWPDMTHRLKSKGIIVKDVEEKEMNENIDSINAEYVTGPQKLALQGGYPTIYKIVNGHVFYYAGDRNDKAIESWATSKNGGKKTIQRKKSVKPQRKKSAKTRKNWLSNFFRKN